ncbi:hypothetical protein AVEN_70646-1 [Araneus ventricosus]|uniref:Uncharacterized protein n=1 Tax=Araneus ventricosus TaxID=182803 RepID=A0A4Y2TDI2_ARAVE|nr:hypothetical protein AVEN_70646-1 [Araneus ventricosus]
MQPLDAAGLRAEGILSSHPLLFRDYFPGTISLKKAQNKAEWLVPPSHHWYEGRKPGLSLSLPCHRQSRSCLSRRASGHLNCLTCSEGKRSTLSAFNASNIKHHLNALWTV